MAELMKSLNFSNLVDRNFPFQAATEFSAYIDLPFDTDTEVIEKMVHDASLYGAIASNRVRLSNSDLIHWCNQRAEHSESPIK